MASTRRSHPAVVGNVSTGGRLLPPPARKVLYVPGMVLSSSPHPPSALIILGSQQI